MRFVILKDAKSLRDLEARLFTTKGSGAQAAIKEGCGGLAAGQSPTGGPQLYARVPTHDPQILPLQIRGMREYPMNRGWSIATQIKEVGSGAVERKFRERLLAAARRREIDAVVVWRRDRWGRSLADLVMWLNEALT